MLEGDHLVAHHSMIYSKMQRILRDVQRDNEASATRHIGTLVQFINDPKEAFRYLCEIRSEAQKTVVDAVETKAYHVLDEKIHELAESRRDEEWIKRGARASGIRGEAI